MKPGLTLLIAAISIAVFSCRSGETSTESSASYPAASMTASSSSATNRILPRAVVYKTNGDFDDLVPITLSADKQAITSYPAPSDITPSQKPVKLADGYLLDRRGININTAFTRYTYAEYASMKTAPSIDTLKAAIMPDAKVTRLVILPMTLNEAINDPAKCDSIIKTGFKGCKIILR
ncbi:MAG: hypothetical protein K1V87_08010 [Muribaculum sp.]